MKTTSESVITLKAVLDEQFNDYKKISLFLAFNHCSFKCDKDCGRKICQNSDLAKSKDKEYDVNTLVKMYTDNCLTSAVVCGGLEPFDSEEDLLAVIKAFANIDDNPDIVIYTGYTELEIMRYYSWIYEINSNIKNNIIIKFGRYVENQQKHFDEILQVFLPSDNQYAKVI